MESIPTTFSKRGWGHAENVFGELYLQVTEADFDKANGTTADPVVPFVIPSVGESSPPTTIAKTEKPNKKRALMALGSLLMMAGVHPVGFEPTTLGSEDRCAIQLRHGCVEV